VLGNLNFFVNSKETGIEEAFVVVGSKKRQQLFRKESFLALINLLAIPFTVV